MSYWVYIVKCSDDSYYTGSHRGSHIEDRIGQHNNGKYEGYTFYRRPVSLVWCQEFQSIRDAVVFERQIKGWNRRKKEALINGDFEALSNFASRRKL